jgi:P-type Cu2+ transporter
VNPETPICFHCGLTVASADEYAVIVDGERRPMCCPGCAAVASAIVDAGLSSYYRHRTSNPLSQRESTTAYLEQLSLYDHVAIQKSFVESRGGTTRSANLVLEGFNAPPVSG